MAGDGNSKRAFLLSSEQRDRRHRESEHEEPPWEEDATSEQISVAYNLLNETAMPCFDLAVFGSHGERALRNFRLTSIMISLTTALAKVVLKGATDT